MFWLDWEATDKDDKEDDVEEGKDVIGCVEAAGRNECDPLGPDNTLDKNTEAKQECLVHGGEVHPGIERD